MIGLLAISGCVLLVIHHLTNYHSWSFGSSNLVVGNLKTSRTVKEEKLEENYSPLPQAVIDGVKSFVFFLGHPHSGHSIVGSVLDSPGADPEFRKRGGIFLKNS